MQIHLTYRNTLRNVKRRVLHNLGFAKCYITRRAPKADISRREWRCCRWLNTHIWQSRKACALLLHRSSLFLQGDGMPKKHLCNPIAPHGCPQKNRHQVVAWWRWQFGSAAVPLEPCGVLTASPIILNPITLCLPKYLKEGEALWWAAVFSFCVGRARWLRAFLFVSIAKVRSPWGSAKKMLGKPTDFLLYVIRL